MKRIKNKDFVPILKDIISKFQKNPDTFDIIKDDLNRVIINSENEVRIGEIQIDFYEVHNNYEGIQAQLLTIKNPK